MTDTQVVFHDRTGNTDHIGLLECIFTNQSRCNLTAQDHHRDGIHEGSGNASDGVGGSRTRGHQNGAR